MRRAARPLLVGALALLAGCGGTARATSPQLPVAGPAPEARAPRTIEAAPPDPVARPAPTVDAAPGPAQGEDPDGDGRVGAADRCPDEPDLTNGGAADDGCPEKTELSRQQCIVVTQRVAFGHGSTKVDARHARLLDDVATVIRGYPDLLPLEITGHADEGERRGDRLADGRAQAVRRALVRRGIDGARLVARGYGSTRPAGAVGAEGKGASANRRVEFVALGPRACPR